MTFRPSANQQRVLVCKDKNILVSASAGTGKTSVMIEKISRILKSGQATLRQVLVVTFTEMAAYEMKQRLVENIVQSDNDEVLAQLDYIDTCDVSTLHSFCSQLVRKYFVEAGIDPAYKILSDAEWTISYDKVIEDLFEKLYADDDEDFLMLVDVFSKKRKDDNLKQIVKGVYEFKKSKVDFDGWKSEHFANYEINNDENYFTQLYNDILTKEFDGIREKCSLLEMEAKEQNLQPLVDCFNNFYKNIYVSGRKTLRQNLDEVLAVKKPAFPEAAATKLAENFAQAEFIEKSKVQKEDMNKIVDKYQQFAKQFSYDQLLQNMRSSCDICMALFDLVQKVDDAFERYKEKNGYLDFSDLEHKAIKVLSDQRVRQQVRQNYKFVFVDEYQDINEVQEEIISHIKGENNLFLVGDVKQNIYAFRQCDPDIFVEKIKLFSDTTEDNFVEFLNENYRSDEDILAFVNHLFCYLMTEKFGSVDYRSTSWLNTPQSKEGQRTDLPCVTIDVIKKEKAEKQLLQDVYCVKIQPEKTDGNEFAEAVCIANRIRELVGSEREINGKLQKISYKDIVILVRGMGKRTKKVLSHLQNIGIPLSFTSKQNLFDSAEIKMITNLFRVVENTCDDVALFGCLTGFLCGIDENDVAKIYVETNQIKTDKKTQKTLFIRLTEYCHANGDMLSERLQRFLAFFEETKFLAQHLTVSQIISKICDKTDVDLYILGLPDGKVRLKNLNEFSASLAEKPYNKSVAEFLRYVDAVGEVEVEVETSSSVDSVKVMTVHKSKGLSLPIVFLIGCGQDFKNDVPDVICDKKKGFATFAFDTKNKAKYHTLSRKIIEDKVKLSMKEEEMRILYVALTRAKNYLFLVGCVDQKQAEQNKMHEEGKNYFDWILGILDKHPFDKSGLSVCVYDEKQLTTKQNEHEQLQESDNLLQEQKTKIRLDSIEDSVTAQMRDRVMGEYAYKFATEIELKAVSSKLGSFQKPQGDEIDFLPKVLSVEDEGELQQNQVGTGYHLVFEHIDFSNKSQQHINDVVKKLVEEGKLDDKVAKAIDIGVVLRAMQSPVFDDIQNKKIYRELPFMLKTSYKNLFGGEYDENMFLQGTMDLLIIDQNQAVVVDYKFTKNPQYIKQNYQKQLDSYAQAVRQILKIDDVKKYVLSLADGMLIEL